MHLRSAVLAIVFALPVFGARSLDQLDDNLRAAEVRLSPEQVARLDQASAFDVGYPYDFMASIQGGW